VLNLGDYVCSVADLDVSRDGSDLALKLFHKLFQRVLFDYAVSVNHDDDFSARLNEACVDGRCFSTVLPVDPLYHSLFHVALRDFPGSVRASVVDDDDFLVAQVFGGVNGLDCPCKVDLLIVGGYQNRDRRPELYLLLGFEFLTSGRTPAGVSDSRSRPLR